MKRSAFRTVFGCLGVIVVAMAQWPLALAEPYGLPPDERAQFRQQLREAHRQRMSDQHRLGVPAAAPSAAPRGGALPHLSVEEREALRHQLREQRRAAHPNAHPAEAVQGPAGAGLHRSMGVGRHAGGSGRDRPVPLEDSR